MNAPLVEARGVGLRFGATTVLEAADLSLTTGDELALTGRSGAGKTSLLLCLAGLVPPSAGTVRWPGLTPPTPRTGRTGRASAPHWPGAAYRPGQVGLVFQAPSLLPELTAAENVMLPSRLHGVELATASSLAAEALELMGLADRADALPGELSGGQQQRVAVARVLAGRPRLVLADEPTGALDRATAAQVLTTLRDRMRATGGALLVATHDEDLARLLPGRARIDDGALTVETTARQAQGQPVQGQPAQSQPAQSQEVSG